MTSQKEVYFVRPKSRENSQSILGPTPNRRQSSRGTWQEDVFGVNIENLDGEIRVVDLLKRTQIGPDGCLLLRLIGSPPPGD